MKRLLIFLASIASLSSIASAVLLYGLFSYDSNWIQIGMHLAFSFFVGIISFCLYLLLKKEQKIQLNAWLYALTLLGLVIWQYISPTAILIVWNYSLGGIVILIGFTLWKILLPNKLTSIALMLTISLLAFSLFFKISSPIVHIAGIGIFIATSILSIIGIYTHKKELP